jgi:hypothetical protein
MFLDSTDAAALYPGRGPTTETAGQSGGFRSFKKKYWELFIENRAGVSNGVRVGF